MKNRFIPIAMNDYIEKHVQANPNVGRQDIRTRLEFAIAAHLAGEYCTCGGNIWVVGSAETGLACFTCITGEAYPNEDYEIDIILSAGSRHSTRTPQKRAAG